MSLPCTSNGNVRETCKLCNVSCSRYTCPKCEIPYCSLQCYKSNDHMECSENFYKQCVEDELKCRETDPEAKRRMMDILRKMQTESMEFDNDDFSDDENSSADSDDVEEIPDLAERLKSVDLDNPDELWEALTNDERQDFEATLRDGKITNFVPSWTPWWSDNNDKSMITEINDDNVESELEARCPKIIDVPKFNELTKASPFVRYNLINVLHTYAYTLLHFNGDHQNAPVESVKFFLQLSDNMRDNKVYEDSTTAIESVFESTKNCRLSSDDEEVTATKEAANLIINGPYRSNSNFYVMSALSDLHRLFENAKDEYSSHTSEKKHQKFPRKFRTADNASNLSKKIFLLCIKKIEYYLSWVKNNGRIIDE